MMRKASILLGLTALCTACGPKPDETATKFIATVNTNDAAAIVGIFADDPYVDAEGKKLINKEEITSWLAEALPTKPQISATSPLVNKNGKFDFTMALARADWTNLGVPPLAYNASLVVHGDKVKLFTFAITDEAKAQLKGKISERNGKWLTAMQDAIKTRNPGAIKQLITPDVRFDVPDKGSFGKEGIDDWVKVMNTTNTTINCCTTKQEDGEWNGTFSSDTHRAMKMETLPVETNAEFGDDGHIKTLAIVIPDATKAKVEAASKAAAATAAAEAEKDAKKKKKH